MNDAGADGNPDGTVWRANNAPINIRLVDVLKRCISQDYFTFFPTAAVVDGGLARCCSWLNSSVSRSYSRAKLFACDLSASLSLRSRTSSPFKSSSRLRSSPILKRSWVFRNQLVMCVWIRPRLWPEQKVFQAHNTLRKVFTKSFTKDRKRGPIESFRFL